MCRLALMNNEGIRYVEENYGLENLFNYLEKRLGGHGNGFCIIYKDGSYSIDKGVQLSNDLIATVILKEINKIRWIIYHTRLASIGGISNDNCHPFEYNRKVLAMNGTEREYPVVKKGLTDTENILLSSDSIMEDTKKYHSVFLGYENGKVFANKNNGSLEYLPCKNGGKVFASVFPEIYYRVDTIYEAPQNFVEGTRMKPLEPIRPSRYFEGHEGHFKRYYNYAYNG